MTEPTSSPPAVRADRQTTALQLFSAFLAPIFFVIAFPLLFVGAIHKPTPHEMDLLIVGPTQVVSQITSKLDATTEFHATHTDVVSEARRQVENRSVVGSLEIATSGSDLSDPTFTVTTYLAAAEGRSVSATIQTLGTQVAEDLGTTTKTVDVAPLDAEDPLGTTLFYLLTYTSLAAYLVIIVLTQVMPKAGLRARYGAVGITSFAAPLIVFGLSSIFIGDYGASFGTIAALLGVNALYVFTVGALAILLAQFLGKLASVGVMGFIVLLNFPSSGGPTPASMLPPFWQGMHQFYFGSGAYEAFRSIVYFDGNGAQRWLLQLLAWTVGLILITTIVHLTQTIRRQRLEIAASRTENFSSLAQEEAVHRHLAVESPVTMTTEKAL